MTYYSRENPSRVSYERNLLMPFTLRQMGDNDKLCQYDCLHVFHDLYPPEVIAQILSDTQAWEARERVLNMVLMIYEVMALSLYPRHSQAAVLRTITGDLGLLRSAQTTSPATEVTEAAICYRRKQLDILPFYRLFRQVCHPLATPQTKGAFRLGRRVMAIDATLENVADTPVNDAFFGRINAGQTRSPFPQVRCTYLAECATHAVVDVALSPCRSHEARQALFLLPSLEPDMLVTMDCGVFGAQMFWGIRKLRAHALARLESTMLRHPVRHLRDGTYLAKLRLRTSSGSQTLLVRVIEYTLTDPKVLGAGQIVRLVTTLLNPRTAPALELIELYHERWEIELIIDEHKNHQRLAAHPLRSRSPQGVVQELYGLLLAHYGLRSLMHHSAVQAGLDPERVSLTRTIQLLHSATHLLAIVEPAAHPVLMQRLLEEMREQVLPERRLRFNARVVKRPFSKFKRKYPCHLNGYHLKKLFREIILLI